MDQCRKYLKYASIINFIVGALMFYHMIYSAFLLIIGFLLLSFSFESDDKLMFLKKTLIVLGIVLIPLNLIASILILAASGKIYTYRMKSTAPNAPPVRIKYVMDDENKKIDILLKLGVGMVFVSGILFATTSWSFISDMLKAICLILFGVLFLGLSVFTEKKLKLYKSSYMYWLLSMSFFLLTIIGMLYFGVIGDYLTYGGSGRSLALFITFFTISGLSYATYLKYPKYHFLYYTYTGILLMLVNFLKYLNVQEAFIVIVILSILFVITIFCDKKSVIYSYSKIIIYLMFVFIIRMGKNSNDILVLIASLINILNLYYLNNVDTDSSDNVFSLFSTYFLIAFSMYNLSFLENYRMLFIFLLVTIHTLFIKFKIILCNESYEKNNYIIYTITTCITYFISFLSSYSSKGFPITSILSINEHIIMISILYLFMTIFYSKDVFQTRKITSVSCMQPFALFLVFNCFSNCIINDYRIKYSLLSGLLSIIYAIIHKLVQDKELKSVYKAAIIVSIFISGYSNMVDGVVIPALLIIISSSYLFLLELSNENINNKDNMSLSYILFLGTIFNLFEIVHIFGMDTIFNSTILILIYFVLSIFINNERIKNISYIAVAAPLFIVANDVRVSYEYRQILYSAIVLYITFLITRFFCKKDSDKNIIGTIGIVASMSSVFLVEELVVGLYVGIVGIIVTLLGFYKKELKGFFIVGIIITILNIIVQLNDLWENIPFWLYLLLAGLAIIGFVTCREIKKSNQNK